ncbi:uncharacterized protein LOC130290873 isoform X5 [Hyla sarda]|uniref:uncharacterized protein LOC130290873 isoform X5 n=1 Tax=Hyla sarda TaxID=327740 RepID=UPI0024C21315|nr:uncharacterized protein LOC130290873 isoform X5 [Hyla sarda]
MGKDAIRPKWFSMDHLTLLVNLPTEEVDPQMDPNSTRAKRFSRGQPHLFSECPNKKGDTTRVRGSAEDHPTPLVKFPNRRGSVNGSHVSGATPAVTPKANAQTSAVTGSHSNVSASTGKVNTSSKPATSNSQPHASSGNRPSVVSGLLVNPCPNQCPNGIGGNPPCVCAVPLV